MRSTAPAAGVVVRDEARGVLLLWRHRFITDTWGWEVPAGRREPGASIEQAAAREVLVETGWAPVEEVRRLVRDGGLPDGLSLTALLWALLHGEL